MRNSILFIGMLVCYITGSSVTFARILCAVINAYGGGLTRDAILLHVHPSLFTLESFKTIFIFELCYRLGVKKFFQKHPMLITFFDAATLWTFIVVGFNKAIEVGATIVMASICSIVTAIGGGILKNAITWYSEHRHDSIMETVSWEKILRSLISPYRVAATINALIYTLLIGLHTYGILSEALIAVTTTVSIILVTPQLRASIAKHVDLYLLYPTDHWATASLLINRRVMIRFHYIFKHFTECDNNYYLIKKLYQTTCCRRLC